MNTLTTEQPKHIPLPWGIEKTNNAIWIGSLRKDSTGKVEHIVCHFDIQGMSIGYRERMMANAELIVSSVNAMANGMMVEHLKTVLVEMSKEDVYRKHFETTMETLRLALDELARMREAATPPMVIKDCRVEEYSGSESGSEYLSNITTAENIARMVTAYVEGGLNAGTDWRNGLAYIIGLRLERLKETQSDELAGMQQRAETAERELKTIREQIEAIVPDVQRLEEAARNALEIIS